MSGVIRRYYRGHRLVTLHEAEAGNSRVYHFDHIGTTLSLTENNGVVSDRFSADAWGVTVTSSGPSINRQWYVGNNGYSSSLNRQISYVRSRYLDCNIGVWISRDPELARTAIARRLQYNNFAGELYSYAMNRPELITDPSGEDPCKGPHECQTYPGGPCAYAVTQFAFVDAIAAVVCCEGTAYICTDFKAWTPPGVKHCIRVHERYHLDYHLQCEAEGYSEGEPLRPGISQIAAECEAFRRELACYDDSFKNICKSELNPIQRAVCESERNKAYCQAANSGNEKCLFGKRPLLRPKNYDVCPRLF